MRLASRMLKVEVQFPEMCFVKTVILCVKLDLRTWIRGGPAHERGYLKRTAPLFPTFVRLDVPTLVSPLGSF